jgi:hypothetical protein
MLLRSSAHLHFLRGFGELCMTFQACGVHRCQQLLIGIGDDARGNRPRRGIFVP